MSAHAEFIAHLKQRAERLDSGEHADYLAEQLAETLRNSAPPAAQTGTLRENVSVVFEAKRNGPGIWASGVGDRGKIGEPSDKPPAHTISQFLKEIGGPIYGFYPGRQGKVASRYAWWALPRFLKDRLQQERLAGRYGGETSVGVGRSPYLYPQDGSAYLGGGASSARANITPTHFVETAVRLWRTLVSQYVRSL